MDALLDFFIDPFRFAYMQKAFLITFLIALPMAAMSSLMVLKGWSLLGDAMSHAVFPGIVAAFLMKGNLLLGALIAAVLAVLGSLIGAVSLTGSVIAWAKLDGRMDKRYTFPAQQVWNLAIAIAAVAAARLKLQAVSLHTRFDLDQLTAAAGRGRDDAAGDAAADVFGLDLGL